MQFHADLAVYPAGSKPENESKDPKSGAAGGARGSVHGRVGRGGGRAGILGWLALTSRPGPLERWGLQFLYFD